MRQSAADFIILISTYIVAQALHDHINDTISENLSHLCGQRRDHDSKITLEGGAFKDR
jgi:hypothetical protein